MAQDLQETCVPVMQQLDSTLGQKKITLDAYAFVKIIPCDCREKLESVACLYSTTPKIKNHEGYSKRVDSSYFQFGNLFRKFVIQVFGQNIVVRCSR